MNLLATFSTCGYRSFWDFGRNEGEIKNLDLGRKKYR
jgi:hypothetical protein